MMLPVFAFTSGNCDAPSLYLHICLHFHIWWQLCFQSLALHLVAAILLVFTFTSGSYEVSNFYLHNAISSVLYLRNYKTEWKSISQFSSFVSIEFLIGREQLLRNLLLTIVSGVVTLVISRGQCRSAPGQHLPRPPPGLQRGFCHSCDPAAAGSVDRVPCASPFRAHGGRPSNDFAEADKRKLQPNSGYLPPPRTKISSARKPPPYFPRTSRLPDTDVTRYNGANNAEKLNNDIFSISCSRNVLERFTKTAIRRILMCPLFYEDVLKIRYLRERKRQKLHLRNNFNDVKV
ncbi:uncharacterized protein LOC125046477 [Penaeus chinensis]|uniref:uncharacterized protein LOC125046477 n=1 Tax=Penaeus chinensis TaxID=139456 RepID=UPI001FB79E4B|nr:uncharacterized protein LOC125046477 [Penaeus chinensis]